MYGSFFEEQARALRQENHKVGIFYPSYYNFSNPKQAQGFTHQNDHGLPTYAIQYKSPVPRFTALGYLFFCRKALSAFRTYIKNEGKPDVIHAHSCFFGGLVARYISRKTNIPYILTKHYSDLIYKKKFFLVDVVLAKHIINKAKKVIAVSNGYAQNMAQKLELPQATFTVIPNLVNPIFLAEKMVEKPHKTEQFRFLTVSFIDKRKNIPLILQAFAQFLALHSHATLRVCGTYGDLLPELEQLCHELGISRQVGFSGTVTRTQLVAEYQQANCFLLASQYESFGVVLIEALAMGLPIISTNSVGPQDIINDKNGVLTQDFEVATFFNAMMHIYENYHKYPPADLRKECAANFSSPKIAQLLLNTYQEAIKA